MLSSPSSLDPPPRFGTPRRPERPSFGPRIARIAEKLGQPLMPWQRLAAEVGGELVPVDRSRDLWRPAYRTVVVTVARQNGKTMLVLSWELDRALMWGSPQRVAYTAQTGSAAGQKLVEDQLPILEGSPLAPLIVDVGRRKTEEHVLFAGGSRIGVLPSTQAAGHGKTIGLAVIDEAFDPSSEVRDGGVRPAMRAVPDAQLLATSTMGTEASTWWNRMVSTGRAAVADGVDEGLCYVEWSSPEGADSDDWDAVALANPALGHTITLDTLKADRLTMDDDEWRRTAMNLTNFTDSERPIPSGLWAQVLDDAAAPSGRMVAGAAVSIDQRSAAVVVVDESGAVEVVAHDRGVSWLPDVVERLGLPVAIDEVGPAGQFVGPLRGAGVAVVTPRSVDIANACTRLVSAVSDRRLRVRPHEGLSAAVDAGRRRWSGDRWWWGRKGAEDDVSPVEALTLAFSQVSVPEAKPEPVPVPMFAVSRR